MAREYFCAYHSYIKTIEPLTDVERGRLFAALLRYSITGEAERLTGGERYIYPMMCDQMDRDKNKYEEKCEINKKNGSMGGKRTVANGSERPPNAPQGKGKGKDKEENKEKDKEEDKDKEIKKEKRVSRAREAPLKVQFAEFVSMTNAEREALVTKLGEHGAVRCIEILDNYKGSTGKKYVSDYRAVLNWVVKRHQEEQTTVRPAQKSQPLTGMEALRVELEKRQGGGIIDL